jgi:hypothetical protein
MPWFEPRAKPWFSSFTIRRTSGCSARRYSSEPSRLPFSTTITSQAGFSAAASVVRHAAR